MTISMDLRPPLVWVLVDTGQLVTVVYTTSVVMTALVEMMWGAVVVAVDLIRRLLVMVDEEAELDGVLLEVEDAAEVLIELDGVLDDEDTAGV